jgi:hypothetical protein
MSSSTACAACRRNRRHRHRAFLQSLKAIGYDGPVTPSRSRRSGRFALGRRALEIVGASMDKIFHIAA